MLRERSQDGTTGQTGVRDKPKILLRLLPRPGVRLAPMTRDFHPGPELLVAPYRGRRYECSLSVAPPASLAVDAASAACGFSLLPPFQVRRPGSHSASAAMPETRLEQPPANGGLPHPPADGFLRSQTPPRPPHFHREPEESKVRPASRPPPQILAGLDGGVQIRRIWEGETGREGGKLPRPGPSVAKAPSG
jgi:hypothetical protein